MISRLTGEVNQISYSSLIPETQSLDFNSEAFSSAILKAFLLEGSADESVTDKWQPMDFKTT
jgi:hypothetical protein